MKNGWNLVIVAVALVVLGMPFRGIAATTNTTSEAGELLRKAYEAVVNAELAHSELHEAEAAAAYRTALGLYGRLQAEYPGWQAAMVSYRVAECQNQLAALESSPRDSRTSSNLVTAVTGDTNEAARLQSLLIELREARAALSMQPNRTSVANDKLLEEERDRFRDELDRSEKANRTLLRKVAKLEAKLNRAGITEGTNTLCRAVASAVKAESRRMMDRSELAKATDLLREAVELMPSEADLVVQLAVALCRDGKFGDAVAVLAPFDVKHATNSDALMTLGTAYMGLGQIGPARVATEKALKINPESAELNYNMAQILISLMVPEPVEAQQYYRRALELGLEPDPEFENSLRAAMIISRLKKHGKDDRRGTVDRGTSKALPIPFRK